ncbi:MAG: Spy/CpxP family protein refolding chaperone [Leptolyngbya sp. BL-A-14]
MKRSIATTMLLGALLAGGVSACSQTTSSETPQAKTTDTTSSNAPQTDSAPSTDRAQRREAMRKQIEAVLTPEQSQQLQAKLQQGVRMREAMASLNLTPEQKTKIRDIMKAARAQRQGQPSSSTSQ